MLNAPERRPTWQIAADIAMGALLRQYAFDKYKSKAGNEEDEKNSRRLKKLRILTAMKKIWGHRLTAIWPRQGHYARDPQATATYPPPDLTIERIGDLVNYDLPALLGAGEDRHASFRV